jgi:uncharacterized membrane protein (UPF0127 family)
MHVQQRHHHHHLPRRQLGLHTPRLNDTTGRRRRGKLAGVLAQKLIPLAGLLGIIACNLHCVTTSAPISNVSAVTSLTLHTAAAVVTLAVEVANDEPARERGLMFRKSMPTDHGMLFIFPDELPRSFWMKNTYLPLDIIFINSTHQVVGVVHHAEPLTMTPRSIPTPAQYVLEVNAGFAKRFGVDPDTAVTFVGLPKPSP